MTGFSDFVLTMKSPKSLQRLKRWSCKTVYVHYSCQRRINRKRWIKRRGLCTGEDGEYCIHEIHGKEGRKERERKKGKRWGIRFHFHSQSLSQKVNKALLKIPTRLHLCFFTDNQANISMAFRLHSLLGPL